MTTRSQVKYFFYLRKKVLNPTPEFIKVFAESLASTLARMQPINYSTCEKFVAWRTVVETEPQEAEVFKAAVIRQLRGMRSTRHHRLMIGFDIISGARYHEVRERLDAIREEDTTYYGYACHMFDIRQYSCGHFAEEGGYAWVEHEGTTHVCKDCLADHVCGYNGYWIKKDDVVEAWINENRKEKFPRWHSEILFDDDLNAYRHINYDPWRYLIGSYHSAKCSGFDFFESSWTRMNKRYFGVELEVESSIQPTAIARKIHKLVNADSRFISFERDGSLSSSGFEMVSMPAGLDTHAEMWAKWMMDESITSKLRSHDTTTCGLHVHVSKAGLSEPQIAKMQSFINDTHNKSMISRIARRWGGNYAKTKSDMVGLKRFPVQTGDRYEALNITGKETVEFRLFKGTIRHQTLMAALEFVNALIVFSQIGRVSFTKFNAAGFKEFIQTPPMLADTKYLRKHLKLVPMNNTRYTEAA